MRTENADTASPVRVVHLLHTMDYGGVETIIINWLRALDPGHVDASLVCFANPGGTERLFIEAAERAGLSVQTIPWNRRKPLIRSSTALIRLLQKKRAQIVHTHNTYADLVGLLAARRLGIQAVSSLYVWSAFGWKRRALEWISQRALRHFDCVTAQCEATKRDTCLRGIDSAKVKVLHTGYEAANGLPDARSRQEQRDRHGVAPEDILLVNVARLYPEKAHAILLQEFLEIHDKCPNTRLWILGRGPLEEELRMLCSELGLDDAVKLVGYVPNPQELTSLADIQVHPSFIEGIPMALLLGMSLGLPIVASAVGGIAEVISQDERGILVPAAGEDSFRDEFRGAVLRLVQNADERRRLGENARKFIKNDYSLESAAITLENIYREVVNS